MGTRCLTVFKDGEEEIAVMYRQFDGHPEAHGKDPADFLKGRTLVNGIPMGASRETIFNGMGCLAASVIARFKDGVGGIYLHPSGTRDCGEEYTYVVSGETGKEPSIAINNFNGRASEYQDWLEYKPEKKRVRRKIR